MTLFGSMFNDIYIDRINANGVVEQTIKVPISYGPKDRYITRALQNPDLLRPVSMVFPRMSFEINSVRYNPDNKYNTIGRNSRGNSYSGSVNTQYMPVPYDFDITLSVIARNADDATRIIEQILPFFTPEWTTTLNLIPELDLKMDIPIVLKSVDLQDTYESDFESKQFVIWTLGFTLHGLLYGPINRTNVIKHIDINFYTPTTETAAEGVNVTDRSEYVTIEPGLDINGNPTTVANNSIPLSQIYANSNYGFIVDFMSTYMDTYKPSADFSNSRNDQYVNLLLF